MTKLTKRQQEILKIIQAHIAATGSPPTRAEIAKTMGFKSPNAAEDHLRALARKGAIELVPSTSRGIRLPQQGVPVIEQKISKSAVLAEENIHATLRIERNFFQPQVDFFLRINSDEFQSIHIQKGDYIAVYQTEEYSPSHWVVIRQNQELTLRRFSPELQTQNLTIEGRMVGLIRSTTTPSLT